MMKPPGLSGLDVPDLDAALLDADLAGLDALLADDMSGLDALEDALGGPTVVESTGGMGARPRRRARTTRG